MLEADWQRDCYLLHIVQLCVCLCVYFCEAAVQISQLAAPQLHIELVE